MSKKQTAITLCLVGVAISCVALAALAELGKKDKMRQPEHKPIRQRVSPEIKNAFLEIKSGDFYIKNPIFHGDRDEWASGYYSQDKRNLTDGEFIVAKNIDNKWNIVYAGTEIDEKELVMNGVPEGIAIEVIYVQK